MEDFIALIKRLDPRHKQRLFYVMEGMLLAEDLHNDDRAAE